MKKITQKLRFLNQETVLFFASILLLLSGIIQSSCDMAASATATYGAAILCLIFCDLDRFKKISGLGVSVILREPPPIIANLVKSAKNANQDDEFYSMILPLLASPDFEFLKMMAEQDAIVAIDAPYIYEINDGSSGTGSMCLPMLGQSNRLVDSNLAKLTEGDKHKIEITEFGSGFVKWIQDRPRCNIASFFWTTEGGWGDPKPGGSAEEYLRKRKAIQQRTTSQI